jgi:hypothetical protein
MQMEGSASIGAVHPRMLRADSEPHPQELGKQQIGRAIEAAIERARLTKQAVAFAMGYSDSGVMGRWINGTETPQFAKLWAVGGRFRHELVIALAEEAGMRVETTIRSVA